LVKAIRTLMSNVKGDLIGFLANENLALVEYNEVLSVYKYNEGIWVKVR
jgi:hypothetical protein